MDSSEEDAPAEIRCTVTRWYYRRMGLVGLMLVFFGCYFLYDWKVGYPKANAHADRKDWFEDVLLPSWDEAQQSGGLAEWLEEAEAKDWPMGENGEPPKWVQYSAANGWPEDPKRYTDREVQEQLYWGLGTLAAALFVGVLVLLNRNKVLIGREDHLVTPEGASVSYSSVHRVDKRKWEHKGLAYAFYRETEDGKELKAVIDDLKFGGADKVLDRLLGRFKGELIEKIEDPEDEDPDAESTAEGAK